MPNIDFKEIGTEFPLLTVDRFWQIDADGAIDAVVTFDDSESGAPNTITLSEISAYSYKGSSWEELNSLAQLTGMYQVTSLDMTGNNTLALFDLSALCGFTNNYSGPATEVWNSELSWSRGHIPLTCNDVVIPSGVNVLIENGKTANCNSLIINGTSELKLASNGVLNIMEANE